jgi:hypothetical protein
MNNDHDLELLKLNVDIWKKVIDVQQHFNDLEMKVRNFGLLVVAAFISAIGVSLKSQYETQVWDQNIPIAAFLALGALIIWLHVFLVDVYWYHPLLKGAVLKGIDIENEIKTHLPNVDLTQKIGEQSAVDIFCFKEVRSTTKAKFFYSGISFVLLALTIILATLDINSKAAPVDKATLDLQKVSSTHGAAVSKKINLQESTNKTANNLGPSIPIPTKKEKL